MKLKTKIVKYISFSLLTSFMCAAVSAQNLGHTLITGTVHMSGDGGSTNYPFRIDKLLDDGGRFRVDENGKVFINVPDADKSNLAYGGKNLIVNGMTLLKNSLIFAPSSSYDQLVLYDDGVAKSVIKGGLTDLTYIIGTTNSQHKFVKRTYSGTETELMRIQSNGNVGIGTISPQAKLTSKRRGGSCGK